MTDSPLVKLILSALFGYLLVFLILSFHDWYKAEYPEPPPVPPKTASVRYAYYHEKAAQALDRFSRLPESEKDLILRNLNETLISVDEWLKQVDRINCPVICLGELHEESTRRFLSEAIFDDYPVDMLLLEATPRALSRIMKKLEAGRAYFPLLNADIMNVLRSVRKRQPDCQIHGIEETNRQQRENKSRTGSRDRSIAVNFWNRYQPGKRIVILFGALHCRDEPHWLFGRLKDQAPAPLKPKLLNAWVLEEHQNGPLEAFIYFLDQVGVKAEAKSFVIPDTGALHPRLREWFDALDHQILNNYSILIVFRR